MNQEEIKILKKTLSISAVVLIPAAIIFLVLNPVSVEIGGHNTEKVRRKMKNYLREKYEKEFIVDRIGTRSSDGEKFYQARIYPKEIIGTKKEGDEYYYASATADKLLFGRLGEVGDSYSYVARNIDMEKYLLPAAKKKFGRRVLLKVDVEHEVTGDGSWWAGYKSESLKEMRKKVKNDPKHNRILLDLDVYIFNKIEDKAEKEKRREQIFEFVQYLKKEELFEYLEMAVTFIDERVLAPSYEKYKDKVDYSDKVTKEREGETFRVPPMKLRKEMSRQLQEEVNNMSEEELLTSMKQIQKEDLEALIKYDMQYVSLIYSFGILQEKYSSSITEEDRKNKGDRYNEIKEIIFEQPYRYMYIN